MVFESVAASYRKGRGRLVLVIAVLACLIGFDVQAAEPAASPRGYLLHLNGIGGERLCDHWLVNGLRAGGFQGEFELYDWTGGRNGIEALQGRALHATESRKIAEKIAAYARKHPEVPIYLTSHSGGCGLAVWALEQLPDDVMVESLLMFAPALSPDYDLSKALGHVRGKAYVFSSPHDSLVLGTGTRLFGTIDGRRVEAAGLNGFVRPEGGDPEQYKKLSPQPYSKRWLAEYGNAGSHICALRPKFAREYVAKLLLSGSMERGEGNRPVAAATTQPAGGRPMATP